MSDAQSGPQWLEISSTWEHNMVKSNWGKLHAFLGIIKLLASLEGAEKHWKKISANCNQFLPFRETSDASRYSSLCGFHMGLIRKNSVVGHWEQICWNMWELLSYYSAYSLRHKVPVGMSHKKSWLIESWDSLWLASAEKWNRQNKELMSSDIGEKFLLLQGER